MRSRASSERPANLDRRHFLAGLGVALLGGGCRRASSREQVLARLIDRVVSQDLAEVEQWSGDLSRAAQRLVAAPDFAELKALRACFRRAALAWKRAASFRVGPLSETQALARAAYWPARPAAVADLLESERTPSRELVAELGADVKGLYALEYVLFTRVARQADWDALPSVARARSCELIRCYADDIAAHSVAARRALGEGAQGYAAKFSRASQVSLNQVTSLLAESVENLLAARLELVLWLASLQRLRALDIEGGPSQISHELALALLNGSYRLYAGVRGAGLSELVEQSAPQVHAHLQSVFAGAARQLRSLAAPVEDVAMRSRERVEAALRAVKSLEQSLKQELPSALGVTLTFSSLDAD